ncbi:translation machinery-associated protein 16-like [Xenia sp. Carnegie-2017]|uniref:translation machinery-associated protein 16-like n=1 Tax=Xenia sp. Carnegie-2017 TaxID=2897299 RepID=UPI001F04E9B6|nr:translation machinery-associated protein 16-like [Xenia sp. Carnegie-2017]
MPKAAKLKVSEKVIHPKSRKAAQMIRNAQRKDKLERKKSEKKAAQQNLADKIKWFNEHMNKNAKSCSINDVHNLIFLYFKRFDEELEQLRIGKDFKNRQVITGSKFSRENHIKLVLEKEQQIYTSSGLEIPDLTSCANVEILRAWNGSLDYIPKIKFKRFQRLE